MNTPKSMDTFWTQEFTASEMGGIIAIRGFYYQHLYALRLMARLFGENPDIDDFAIEHYEDFVCWRKDENGVPKLIELVQVKTCESSCFLDSGRRVSKTLRTFAKSIDKLRQFPGAEITCRIVFNGNTQCKSCKCLQRIERSKAYLELIETPIGEHVNTGRRCSIKTETFLPLRFTAKEMLAELVFLDAMSTGARRYLETRETLKDFLQGIIGLILPYKIRQEGTGRKKKGEFNTWQAVMDRDQASTIIKLSLESAIYRLDSSKANDQIQRRLAKATKDASSLSMDPQPEALVDKSFKPLELDPPIPKFAHMLMLNKCDSSIIYDLGDLRLLRGSEGIRLYAKTHVDGMSVRKFVRRSTSTHKEKIQLILSYADAVRKWEKQGLAQTNFRALSPKYEALYRVELTDRSPTFKMGDMQILEPFSARTPLWLEGAVLAKAITILYYGYERTKYIIKSQIYTEAWQDNIILEIAQWLKDSVFVTAQNFYEALSIAFADELTKWPIVAEGYTSQLVYESVHYGLMTISNIVSEAEPDRALEDNGVDNAETLYLLSAKAQVGLRRERGNRLCLHRYAPYGVFRWESARARDRSLSVPLSGPLGQSVCLVVTDQDIDTDRLLLQMFGIGEIDYRYWLMELIRGAKNNRNDTVPLLIREDVAGLEWQRSVLNGLRKPWIIRRLQRRGEIHTLEVVGKASIHKHLEELGYTRDRLVDLRVLIRTLESEKVNVRLDAVDAESNHIQCLDSEGGMPDFSDGIARLIDKGTEAVVREEESLLRRLKSQLGRNDFATLGEESVDFVGRAWRIVQRLAGESCSINQAEADLWNGNVREVRHAKARDGESIRVVEKCLEQLTRGSLPVEYCILTGAAGTGKTRVSAKIVCGFLERFRGRRYPPLRVLVVGCSNCSIDNFARMFLQENNESIVPLRNEREQRTDRLIQDGRVSSDVIEASRRHFAPEVYSQAEFTCEELRISGGAVQRLSHECAILAEMIERSKTEPMARIIVGSHERWRHGFLGRHHSGLHSEILERQSVTNVRLTNAKKHRSEPDDGSMSGQSKARSYSALRAMVIASTVDLLRDLPDLWFDLVVIEEASQVTALKTLKVLEKVLRGRGHDNAMSSLAILFSGDPQQLPPFRSMGKRKRGASDELNGAGSPISLFAAMCQNESNDTNVLTTQYRMHPEIALIVNSLFYASQHWTLAEIATTNADGVFFYDTSDISFGPKVEDGGTSLYNDVEIQVVRKLLRDIATERSVLVISPYSKQVEKMSFLVSANNDGQNTKVQTIDASQGGEADVVIVSCVSLDFNPSRPFVADPRRMNVAFSRARRSLIIVGAFAELCVAAKRWGKEFPHMAGLAELFSDGGRLASRRIKCGL